METDEAGSSEGHEQGKAAAMSAYQHFTESRLQRMMVDWLCRKGFVNSAEKLANGKEFQVSMPYGYYCGHGFRPED